ncbi:MAG: OmpA family protein [Deltaproteobacteria bacterium]|nr:OmpA family protein [Deltaproteobacteria bacterium]
MRREAAARRVSGLVLALSGFAAAGNSYAAQPQLRVAVGASHAISSPQSEEFGWGASGALAGELKLSPALSVQAGLESTVLSTGRPPPPQFAPNTTGVSWMAFGGARLQPFASEQPGAGAGLWLAAVAGYVRTGPEGRPGFGVDLGYEFPMDRFALGPFAGYRQIVQPDSELRGNDARIATLGISGTWAPWRTPTVVDKDWDRDGIVNERDACPRDAEDFDGFEDADGCPELDNDKDGVPDKVDRCPDEPEDRDGFEDADGCPEMDNDKDGILDKNDACPDVAEDLDGFEDKDGCPDPDNDRDEIPDVVDKCPDEPETYNGYADEDGCPDEISVRVVGANIYLDEKIFFEWNKAVIRTESHALVQRIATLLLNHPEYLEISIEGHTDEMGSADYNQRLSESRAKAVRDFLVRAGVAQDRLMATGFGETRPLVRERTEKAASVNRRVEFRITKRRTTLPFVQAAPADVATPGSAHDAGQGAPR